MLGNLVTSLIQKYLSPYIEAFNADQLSVFGWSGKFTLTDVYIKRDALDSFRLPFKVLLGYVGKIDASVPWMNLYTEPIIINLSDIFVLVVPNSDVPYDENEVKEFEWRLKKSHLDNIEEVKAKFDKNSENTTTDNDGFFVKLAVSAIKNVQIFISNVHICYEDLSSSRKPFQIGLAWSKLIFETDGLQLDQLEEIIYKNIRLEKFSFYINFQKFKSLNQRSRDEIIETLRKFYSSGNKPDYILCPINFSTNARINRKPEESNYKHPIFDLQMYLDSTHIALDHNQVQALLLLFDSIDRRNRATKYLKWRPKVPVKENPRLWWKFAFTAIAETGTRRRKREFSWDHIELACKRRKRYFELYKRKLLGENVDKELEELERFLNLIVIVMMRANAELATKKILKDRQIDKANSGWFSGWWSSTKNDEKKAKGSTAEELEALKKEFTEGEEKAKLYQAIGYDENALSIIYPPEYIAYKLNFKINGLDVTIKNREQRILSAALENFDLNLKSRPNTSNIEMKCVVDQVNITGAERVFLMKSTVNKGFMILVLEKNPLDKKSDISVSLQMKSLHFIYDVNTFNQIVRLFTPPEDISLQNLQTYTQYKWDNLRLTTYSQVQQALDSHKQVKIDMKVDPSFIIVPKKGNIAYADILLLVSLGELTVCSKLVPKTNSLSLSNNSFNSETLKEMIYERYTMQIKNVQVVLSDREHWKKDLEELNTVRHILCPMELMANISQSILDKDVRFPKIVFSGNIPQIELKASDTQISQLLILLTTLPFGPEEKRREESSIDVTDDGQSMIKSTEKSNISVSYNNELIHAMNYAAKSATEVVATIKAESERVDGPEPDKIIAYKELEFDFKLDDLKIVLYITDRKESSSLARFVLDKFWVYGQTFSEKTNVINCCVNELRMDDIRPGRNPNGINTILCKSNLAQNSSINDKSMITVFVAQKKDEILITFNMSGFSLILATHYLLFLADVAQKAFKMEEETVKISAEDLGLKSVSVQTFQAISAAGKSKHDSSKKLIIDCEFGEIEAIMLESLEDKNSDIMVFKFSAKVNLAREGDVTVLVTTVNQIQMALSNYSDYVHSGQLDMYIMAPTDIIINGTLRDSTHMIDFSFDDDININISPNMFRTILHILSAMGKSEIQETSPTDDSTVDVGVSLLDVKKIDQRCWYLNCATPAKEALTLLQEPDTEQKSNLIFNFHRIKILVKSGGIEAHPLINVEISIFAKFIGNKTFDFESTLIADYYNHSVSSWEPLIEPVDNKIFAIHGNILLGETTNIKIFSRESLELLLSKSAINVMYDLSDAFTRAIRPKNVAIADANQVIIKNYLGKNVQLLLRQCNVTPVLETDNQPERSKKIKGSKTKVREKPEKIFLMKPGKSYSFYAQDPNNVILRMNLLLSETIVIERTVSCQKSSVRCFSTAIRTYPVPEHWKFVVQVVDSGITKEILIRSNAEISNKFDESFDLYTFDSNHHLENLGTIKGNSKFYLPLQLVYGQNPLYVKPKGDFNLSAPGLLWRNDLEILDRECSLFHCMSIHSKTKQHYAVLTCEKETNSDIKFQIKVHIERSVALHEDTERVDGEKSYLYNIRMIPFARIKNLLPFSIRFKYNPLNEEIFLGQGQEFNLPFIDFKESVMTYYLLDYMNDSWNTRHSIPSEHFIKQTKYLNFFSKNSVGQKLVLAVELNAEHSLLYMSLYSTFWILNRTGEELQFKVDGMKESFPFKNNSKTIQLFTYNPQEASKKSKLSLKIGKSEFSTYFPVDVVPNTLTLAPQVERKPYSYLSTLRIQPSFTGFTKILSIEPFYSVINLTETVYFFSENNEDWFEVDPSSLSPFFPRKTKNQTICFKTSDSKADSKHVSLRESSQTLLRVHDRFIFVEVDVTEFEAKIRIGKYFDGAAPVLIVNALHRNIFYGQSGVSDWNTMKLVYSLPAEHMVYFCWIDPCKTRKLTYKISPNDPEEEVIIEFDNSMSYENYFTVSFLDGKQRVLLFTTDHDLPQNLLRTQEFIKPLMTCELILKGFGLNIVNDERHRDLLYLSLRSKNIWESRFPGTKTFKAVTIRENDILETMYQQYLLSKSNNQATMLKSNCCSGYEADFNDMKLLKPRKMELRRISDQGFWAKLTSSEHMKNIHVRVGDIQIDNQLCGYQYDVVFSPVVVPKSISDKYDIERKNFIELTAIIYPGSINRFKTIQLLIQEFMIQIDIGWVSQLMEVFDVKPENEKSFVELIDKDLEHIRKYDCPKELKKYGMNKSYYDLIMLGPIKLHLSLNLGDVADGNSFFLLDIIIRLTSSVGEISDTLFKLDYFERQHLFIRNEELLKQLTSHYTNQFLMQFYKLIFGLDIIGNPMKLVLGFKKGIGDFFHEPAIGIIHGPEEFVEGMAIGVKSLASNVIGGTAGALGRIGNQIGTGVAALTVDDKYQKERRQRMSKKTTFTESSKNMFRDIFSGITGVVTKPLEGAKEEGVAGLFKGIGKGVAGAFFQPATSVLDFASGQLIAFNDVIDPKTVAQRVRPPRHFTTAELKPYCYSEAFAWNILKNVGLEPGRDEKYLGAATVSDRLIVILTNRHLYCLKQSSGTPHQVSLEWYEPWSEFSEARKQENAIILRLKTSKKGFMNSVTERVIKDTNNDHIRTLFRIIKSILRGSTESIQRLPERSSLTTDRPSIGKVDKSNSQQKT